MAESTVYVYRPRLTLVFSLNIEQKRFSHLRNHSQRHHGAFLSLVSIIQNQPSPGLWVWFIGRRWVRGWLTSLFRLGLLFILPGMINVCRVPRLGWRPVTRPLLPRTFLSVSSCPHDAGCVAPGTRDFERETLGRETLHHDIIKLYCSSPCWPMTDKKIN